MKVVFVSGLLPSGHYSQYITSGLVKQKDIKLLVYTDKSSKNLTVKGCGKIVPVWSKSPKFIIEILNRLFKDRPDIIHFQHEINMYGGIFTALLFPILVCITRLLGFKVVTTIHAAVFKNQIDDEFIHIFNQNPKIVRPTMLYLFFYYVYKSLSLFSDQIIVHTELTKKILISDYSVDANKVNVIPAAIPQKTNYKAKKEKYFFYFGYMARRKGLGYALEGFKKYIKKNPKSPYKFILAGGAIKGQEDSLAEIIKMIKESKMEDRIIYKGFIEEKEQDSLYQKAAAVVIPAILSMGSSGPLYHANSYGKCVIASNIGHFKEDIVHNVTGVLVDNLDWDKAFKNVIDNPTSVRRIEKSVISKVKARSPFKTAQNYLKIYR